MNNAFVTPVSNITSEIQLKYEHKIMLLGSCFSNNIGKKLSHFKFDSISNPFGVLYNPFSISHNLRLLLNNIRPSKDDFFQHNEYWHSWNFHGDYSDTDKDSALIKMDNAFLKAYKYLSKLDYLIITFGTAFIYRFKATNKVVANCHKISSEEFIRERISTKAILSEYISLIESIKKINPKVIILFTVSPIRHLRDGAHKNQLSKSSLLLSIDALCNQFKNCLYFPAYEIMMDELRDYRFYKEDMIHPTQQAVDFIWEIFRNNCISKVTYDTMYQIDKLKLAMAHKPINPKLVSHQEFRKKYFEFAKTLSKQYTKIDFSEELEYFKS